MMHSKEDRPITPEEIEQWYGSFDGDEISRHGWSKFLLVENFEKHRYIYEIKNSAVISIIFYQYPDSDTLEIIYLATVPYERLTGTMFNLFSQLLQEHEGRQIWLECREDNVAAIKLYRRLGLRETGRRAKYYRDGTTAILFNF